jgi:hypothetical protein
VFIYLNNARSTQLLTNLLPEKIYKKYKPYEANYRKIQGIALEISSENDMMYNNLFLKYSPHDKKNAQTFWESLLDTTINLKPAFVKNHYTDEKEVFVQDQSNNIYLINKVGRVIWKIKLNEQINSDIYQVDMYKNGKLQLFFSSTNHLHLIDRNGNYVERYPVKLRAAATAGASVFDYDKNREYRMFIPCTNKKVYCYNIEGNLVKGWKFDKSDTKITSPVQHFRVKDKDYIVFADQYKTYIVNRRGETRVKPGKSFIKSKNNNFGLKKSTKPGLVCTDTAGTVHIIHFDGSVETIRIKPYSSSHFFAFKDIDADNKKDCIFADKNKLEVYNQKGKLLFSEKFNNTILFEPIYFTFSQNNRKLGVVDASENEIVMFNSDGSMYRGFPLKGNTPFSISHFEQNISKFNLIVGSKDNFLYNYILQ